MTGGLSVEHFTTAKEEPICEDSMALELRCSLQEDAHRMLPAFYSGVSECKHNGGLQSPEEGCMRNPCRRVRGTGEAAGVPWRPPGLTGWFFPLSPQDEIEFGYIEAPHKGFPVVLDSPRDGNLKDFPVKQLLVRG